MTNCPRDQHRLETVSARCSSCRRRSVRIWTRRWVDFGPAQAARAEKPPAREGAATAAVTVATAARAVDQTAKKTMQQRQTRGGWSGREVGHRFRLQVQRGFWRSCGRRSSGPRGQSEVSRLRRSTNTDWSTRDLVYDARADDRCYSSIEHLRG